MKMTSSCNHNMDESNKHNAEQQQQSQIKRISKGVISFTQSSKKVQN